MRAFIVMGSLWLLMHLVGVYDFTFGVFGYLEDMGVLATVQEATLLVLLVMLVDWVYLPSVDLYSLIFNKGETKDMPKSVRAAVIRGWFTFIAALVIALALIQYT